MIPDAFFVYAFFAGVLGWAAATRGRSGPGFFALALVLTPILAAVILVLSRGPDER